MFFQETLAAGTYVGVTLTGTTPLDIPQIKYMESCQCKPLPWQLVLSHHKLLKPLSNGLENMRKSSRQFLRTQQDQASEVHDGTSQFHGGSTLQVATHNSKDPPPMQTPKDTPRGSVSTSRPHSQTGQKCFDNLTETQTILHRWVYCGCSLKTCSCSLRRHN